MNTSQRSAIKTLVYADGFNFCLTMEEIWQRWIGHKQVSVEEVKESMSILLKNHQVSTRRGYYFLPGRDQLVILRRNRLRDSTNKYVIAAKIGRFLMIIPTVEAVFITGTVAVGNAEADDDMDMMVVTKAGRLWTTRLGVTGFLEIKGVRRRPNEEECRNKICVNLYLDEQAMVVPLKQRNLYTAHEVIQAKLVASRNPIIAQRFLTANSWVKHYLPNTIIPQLKPNLIQEKENGWEKLAFKLQRAYMAKKVSREIIGPKAAYFHPKDTAKIVLDRYNSALKEFDID